MIAGAGIAIPGRFAAGRAPAGGCEHPPLHGFGQSAALRLVGWLPAVVGDDACIVPGTPSRRQPPRGVEDAAPYGWGRHGGNPGMFWAAARWRGGMGASCPTHGCLVRGLRGGVATGFPVFVGAGFFRPGNPAPPQTSPGGINPAPTHGFCARHKQGGSATMFPAVRRGRRPRRPARRFPHREHHESMLDQSFDKKNKINRNFYGSRQLKSPAKAFILKEE